MSVLTLRIPDNLLKKIEILAHSHHETKAQYIRRMLDEAVNNYQARQEREQMIALSKRVRGESASVNAEMMAADDGIIE